MPPPEGTTIINKIIPPPPKPPRQVIIEQFPPLPSKPQDVIVEKWLPVPPRQRRIFYERFPAPIPKPPSRPIIIQHGQPRVHVQRQIVNAPGLQIPCQRVSSYTDINQVLSQMGNTPQIYSTVNIFYEILWVVCFYIFFRHLFPHIIPIQQYKVMVLPVILNQIWLLCKMMV